MRQDSTQSAGGTLPALVLLLLVVSGLFVMHTVGHLGPHRPTGTYASGSHDMAADETVAAAAVGDLPAVMDHRAEQAPSSPALPLGAVCVAILCALAVLAIVAVLLGRSRGWRPPSAQLIGAVAESMRGPPRLRIGLLIADLAVARN